MFYVVMEYALFSFLVTCMLLQLYYLFIQYGELRILNRNTYNAYMNMIQGRKEDEYHAHLFEDSKV